LAAHVAQLAVAQRHQQAANFSSLRHHIFSVHMRFLHVTVDSCLHSGMQRQQFSESVIVADGKNAEGAFFTA